MVVVHRDAAVLAAAASARLVTRLVDVQTARGHAHVVLTGGGIGIATLAALAASPARDTVDWSALDVWWGDERFLPEGHPDRNATQAREALLDATPLDPRRVHTMPAAGGRYSNDPDAYSNDPDASGNDPDAAASRYAEELAAACTPEDHAGVPSFDVLLLGVGADGHIASLFPGHPGLHERERTVIGVHGSPKPPPTRISLTLPAINAARQVWLLAAGAEKAPAVGLVLARAGEPAVPASGVHGRSATVWLLDRAAATRVPPALVRPASP
jgi:6-phosphogluconolactonase